MTQQFSQVIYCALNPSVCIQNLIQNDAEATIYNLVQGVEIIEIVAGVGLDGFIVYSTTKKGKDEVQMAKDMKERGWDQIFVLATFVPLVLNLGILLY